MFNVISIGAARPENGPYQVIDEAGRELQAAVCFTCIRWFEGDCLGPARGNVIVTREGLEDQIRANCAIISGSVNL